VRTKWGFETLGIIPPKIETTYNVDYFSNRGPAGGLDAIYSGGFVSDTTKQPWNFPWGIFHGYVVDDHGTDILAPPARMKNRTITSAAERISSISISSR